MTKHLTFSLYLGFQQATLFLRRDHCLAEICMINKVRYDIIEFMPICVADYLLILEYMPE